MGGIKDDLEDLDDEIFEGDDKENSDDDFSFDDDEEDEDGDSKGSKKGKSEGSGFDRDSYYFYKDKLVQLSGTIRPKEKNKEGKVISLDFKTADKTYTIIMDTMGQKLLNFCYQEYLVTGLVSKISEKEYTLAVKTYI